MNVPFLDLKAQYLPIKDEIQAALNAVLDKTAFAGGPFVAQFEKEFAQFCQTERPAIASLDSNLSALKIGRAHV